MFSGIHDENDNVYNPKIVRIGLKAHHSVQAVSMDYLVSPLPLLTKIGLLTIGIYQQMFILGINQ